MKAPTPREGKPERLTKRPTIHDVARLTGFSRGSVSRAFNNSPFINEATREKILRVAREIGYQPHALARGIKLGRTKRWGLLLPTLDNPYYAKLFKAFDLEARRQGMFVQLGLFHHDPKISEALVNAWGAGEVDGLLADGGIGVSSPTVVHNLQQWRIPTIFLHGRPSMEFDQVVSNRSESLTRALDSFKGLGHTRVAYVGILSPSCRINPAYLIWKEWMRQRGHEDPERYCVFVSNDAEGGASGWQTLSQRKPRPTGVLAFNDILACGVVFAARQEGITVPKDLSIVGADDIDEGVRLGLTTIRHDLAEVAALALKVIEARRGGDSSPPGSYEVPSQYVMRDSMGPAPAEEPAAAPKDAAS